MGYKLKARESVGDGIRRIVVEDIDDALQSLGDSAKVEPVHEARKRVKRIRATVRLARGAFAKKAFQHENQQFREIGRGLSDIRDADVLVQTFDLIKPDLVKIPAATATTVERLIAERRDATTRAAMKTGEVERARTALKKARARASRWDLDGHGWSALAPGFERVYRDGRSRFDAAVDDPVSDNWHAWRKRVKDLMFHTRVLHGMWPSVFASWTEDLDKLGECLGQHHDLAVLRGVLLADVRGHVPAPHLRTIVAAIDARLEGAEADARKMGERLYKDSPKDVLDRLHACWQTWR
jgi:CHAD domain-containing protein